MARKKKVGFGLIVVFLMFAALVGCGQKDTKEVTKQPVAEQTAETFSIMSTTSATDPSVLEPTETMQVPETTEAVEEEYVLNKHTRKFHKPECTSVQKMKESNRWDYTGTRESVQQMGYEPCGQCRP